jgi:uncharacterized protein YbaP (TraB family)
MRKVFLCRLVFAVALAGGWMAPGSAAGSASVWKVSGPNGGTLYLGGSIHALRGSDYPLPSAFDRAFDASTRIVFEANPQDVKGGGKRFLKAGLYPKGDSLKNHVDPRTYKYLCRFFGLLNMPEEKFKAYRPWLLALMLQAPQLHGLSSELGVEGFLSKRAQANSKPVSGLESLPEGVEIFARLSERESEAFLLLTFIPAEPGSADAARLTNAWRRGDVELIARVDTESFRDFPSLEERIINARNRNWIPKIEGFLRSDQTCFVVVGVGHMGGPRGLLALLRARGYKIEHL